MFRFNRLLLPILAISFMSASAVDCWAEEDADAEVQNSSRARSAIRQHEDRIHEAKRAYLQACIASSTRVIRDLEGAMRVEVRSENLDAANAIQEELDRHTELRDEYRAALASLTAGSDETDERRLPQLRLYIWNSFQSHRGVDTCDIQLRLGDQVVEELEGIELEHTENEAERNIVNLPQVEFDSLVIQVKEWRGHSAGLAEIAIVHRRRNLTERYEVSVDRDRGNKYYDPDNLVDEDADTEWFPNDGERCEITLTLKDEDPETIEDPDEFDEDDEESDEDDGDFFGLPTE